MRSLCSPVLVAVLTCDLFCAMMPAWGQQNKVDSVLGAFPGFHLLTLKERDSDTRAFILKRFPKVNTSVVHADFDGDGHLDYAMLLKNDKSGEGKLVVLLCVDEAKCQTVYQLDITGFSDVAYMRPIAAGSTVAQTEAEDTTTHPSAIKLRGTGIQVNYFEKGKVVLYWNKKLKKIEEVQTED